MVAALAQPSPVESSLRCEAEVRAAVVPLGEAAVLARVELVALALPVVPLVKKKPPPG